MFRGGLAATSLQLGRCCKSSQAVYLLPAPHVPQNAQGHLAQLESQLRH